MKTSLLPCALVLALACAEPPQRPRSEPRPAATARPLSSATRLTDIYPTLPSTAGSEPTPLASLGSLTLLAATDSKHGEELWVTDGTAAGTRLVMDVFPGLGSSSPKAVGVVNGALLFTANHGPSRYSYGRYLWRTDGTAAGTQILDAPLPNEGAGAAVANGQLFFLDTSRTELWKSDGTVAGTLRVTTFPIIYAASAARICVLGSSVFFSVHDYSSGFELWKSDGTALGTVMVKDIRPGSDGSDIQECAAVGDTLFFQANDGTAGAELWKTDGTAAGTVMVKDIDEGSSGSEPEFLTAMGGALYFSASTANVSFELWKSDGTAAGTVMVKEIFPGSFGSSPEELTVVGNTLFFRAINDFQVGSELWKSDGTAAGTVMVKDVDPAEPLAGATPQQLTSLGGILYYLGAEQASGYELWRSDGTEAGTFRVVELFPGTGSLSLLHRGGNALYLSAPNGAGGRELWKSDGTAAGTALVKDIYTVEQPPGRPTSLTNAGGTLFFLAETPEAGTELWKSDGTAAGTVMIKDINPGPTSSTPGELTELGGALFFTASDGVAGPELWKSDGTEAGTVMLELYPGANGSYPSSLKVVNGALYFRGSNGSGTGLWKSDGTLGGTTYLKYLGFDSRPPVFTDVDGTLYFSACFFSSSCRLWKSDGTSSGTVEIKDFHPGDSWTEIQRILPLSGGRMIVLVSWGLQQELWVSDGTTAGTVKLVHPYPGVTELTAMRGKVYYLYGGSLVVTDGTPAGTDYVFYVDRAGLTSKFIMNLNDTFLMYGFYTPAGGSELWKSDGTPAGTVQVRDLWPGYAGSTPAELQTIRQGPLVFSASNGPSGVEVWSSFGDGANTALVADVATGPGSSNPVSLTVSGSNLFFVADDGVHGEELWVVPRPAMDSNPPTVSCPPAQTAEATSAAGALVTYPPAMASDDVTASPPTTYSKASGSQFPFGATTVAVTARDAAGNSASCSFGVTVSDTTAPQLTCPEHQVAEATSGAGAAVTYPPASATDAVSAAVTYDVASGGTFTLGTTPVTVTARDPSGNTSTCRFDVLVRDTGAPQVTCPGDQTAEAISLAGAVVAYLSATATDPVSTPSVAHTHPSGSTFAQGETLVTATATDVAGNRATCTFKVRVQDTIAPTITCPGDQTAEATSDQGVSVSYPPATATDAASTPVVTYDPSPGVFYVGTTAVTATAADAAGNTARCTFNVRVEKSAGGCGCASTPAGAPWLGLLMLVALRRGAQRLRSRGRRS